jgi:hypothetical protein
MAVGQVSSISSDTLQLIATNTPTTNTVSTTTFSSLSGYKKYVVFVKTNQASAGSFYLQINGGTGVTGGAGVNKGSQFQSETSRIVLSDGSTSALMGGITIENADKEGPKRVIGETTGGAAFGWLNVASAVTSITISADTNFTTTPTFVLYGIAA